jgi:hypothetical protein
MGAVPRCESQVSMGAASSVSFWGNERVGGWRWLGGFVTAGDVGDDLVAAPQFRHTIAPFLAIIQLAWFLCAAIVRLFCAADALAALSR